MARNKPSWLVRLEYYPVKGLLAWLRRLPLSWGTRLVYSILRVTLWLMPKRRRIVDENLAQSFPRLSAGERLQLASRSLRNLAKGAAVLSHIPDYRGNPLQGWVEMRGFHHVEEALRAGKGVIAMTAHFGPWEMMAFHAGRYYPLSVVARPLDNPLLDRLLNEIRECEGVEVIAKRSVGRQGLQALRRNRMLGILMDQNFAPGGVFVDFFGRLAATTPVVSILARRTGAPVVPIHTTWKGRKIEILCEPPLVLSQHPDPTQAVNEDTQQMAHVIERWVRETPDQWFWLHNRWKRRPVPGDTIHSPMPHPASE